LVGGRGDMHLQINLGKRSLALKFDSNEGREVLRRLAVSADVFVELSRPGAMQRLGLDYQSLSEINPRIVYCSFSGFGQDGPYAKLAAHGLSADVASGFMPLEDDEDGQPSIPEWYTSIGPRASGLYGAIAILGALFGSRASERGAYLDVSQWDSTVAWHYRGVVLEANEQRRVPAYRELGPKYDVYRCSDGNCVLFAAPEHRLWNRFCSEVGRPDLVTDESGDDVQDYGQGSDIRSSLIEILASRTRGEWMEFGVRTGVPISPHIAASEILENEHFQARQMVRQEAHPLSGDVWVAGYAAKISADLDALNPAPELGQHTDDVLSEYGFDENEVHQLREHGLLV
jgi:crotonobetainyl-CoA:carnitine CoA-transferase CaiB-like acyl-CoA transferase